MTLEHEIAGEVLMANLARDALLLSGFIAVLSVPAIAAQGTPSPSRTTDISDLPADKAKAEVKARTVASATTLNGAHGAPVDDDKVVCHREETTGSHISGPAVCATKRVWRQRARDSQDFTDDYETRAHAFGIPGADGPAMQPFSNPLPPH